jgi:hypothetical protein
MQSATSTSSIHVVGTVPTFQALSTVGGAAYTANSFNFTPAVSHTVPQHQGHVYVEHNNGIFIPLSVHNQIENKKLREQDTRGGAFGTAASWNFHEDAKDYQERLETVMRFLSRLRDMVNGLACGFALFKIMELYTTSARNNRDVFLSSYEQSQEVVPKCFLFLTVLLLVLSLLPMGFDLAMQSLAAITFGSQFSATAQRSAVQQQQQIQQDRSIASNGASGGVAAGTSSSGGGGRFGRFATAFAANTYQRFFQFLGLGSPADSPLRHLIQVRFVAFLVALVMTVLEMAVVDQKALPLTASLSSSDVQKLHAAIIARAVVLLVSWLFSLKDF